ncbi:Protein of unknown function [Pyronema omphalodes CBS 100304]|uniref:Uncharacterized protein n=1 Tax=Pyronema omphalodes (strain CBS 100304) TaxID=1076935 RepID=U4LBG9_PYROM|nr:Protein of unknown function [Pyronema omphalodes CBS 100304]
MLGRTRSSCCTPVYTTPSESTPPRAVESYLRRHQERWTQDTSVSWCRGLELSRNASYLSQDASYSILILSLTVQNLVSTSC